MSTTRGEGISFKWSPDLDRYLAGETDAGKIRCVLCEHAPCDCPPFGSPEYFALVDRAHGRGRGETRIAKQHRTTISGVPSRSERYAPSIIAGDDELERGINVGINVTVTRNDEDYATGTVTMITTDCFELTNDTGSELIYHDPGADVQQVITVHYLS